MNPKIIFQRAAPMYEQALRKIPEYVMPEDGVYEQKIEALNISWSELGPNMFEELKTITRLEWMDADIRCYVVSGTKASFSHPLTLKLYDTDEQIFDTFVHELMHRLLNNTNHPQWYKDARKKFMENYTEESVVTKNHIFLHAIHAELVLHVFDQGRLDRMLALVHSGDYLRAWEIVHEYGREQLLKDVFDYNL